MNPTHADIALRTLGPLVTAHLEFDYFADGVANGRVRDDVAQRFHDGEHIHTSEVKVVYILTRNSLYMSGPEALKPRMVVEAPALRLAQESILAGEEAIAVLRLLSKPEHPADSRELARIAVAKYDEVKNRVPLREPAPKPVGASIAATVLFSTLTSIEALFKTLPNRQTKAHKALESLIDTARGLSSEVS